MKKSFLLLCLILGGIGFQVLGSELEYSSYLGGSKDDGVFAVAVSSAGNIFLTGTTNSTNFPTMNSWQPGLTSGTPGLDYDIFFTSLDSSGFSLLFSTYIGGSRSDQGYALDFFPNNDILLLGVSLSQDFPTLDPIQAGNAGTANDLVFLRFQTDGTPVYSTYFGGTLNEGAGGITGGDVVVTDSGGFVVGSYSVSQNFPTLNPIMPDLQKKADMVLVRFDSDRTLLSSTYLGGTSTDHCYSLDLGPDGSIYLAGKTASLDFPTQGAYQPDPTMDEGTTSACIIRVSSDAQSILYSSYLGGDGYGFAQGVRVSSDGCFYLYGTTDALDFPTQDPYQSAKAGGHDCTLTKFLSTGSGLIYSTYLGGANDENNDGNNISSGLALDSQERLYLSGTTYSQDFPTVNPSQAGKAGVSYDAFYCVLASDGQTLELSSYLGGESHDYGGDCFLDDQERLYLGGWTFSPNFPTIDPYQPDFGGYELSWGDGFVARVSALATASPTPSVTPSVTPSATPTASSTPTISPTPEGYKTPSATPTNTPSPTPSPSTSPTPSPTCGPELEPGKDLCASADYDGDGSVDLAWFRPSEGLWKVRGVTRVYFGGEGDIPASGDYDGDGCADIAFFRPATKLWKIKDLTRFYFAKEGDISVPGDYDGDGTTEPWVFRESEGFWLIRDVTRIYFGQEEDWPIRGDYLGVGGDQLALYRPSTRLWWVKGETRIYFGQDGDRPIPADYNGDGSLELAIYRPCVGLWKVRDLSRIYFGTCLDYTLPGDYDGDGTSDPAYFRPYLGLWNVRSLSRVYFGQEGDLPLTRTGLMFR